MTNAMVRATDVNVDELGRIGKMLALSGYFDAKGNFDTQVAQMCTKVLAGREMGYGPFASVQGIHLIQGRPSVSANLMAAAVKASGKYDYRVRQMTDKVCEIEFLQRNGDKWESIGVSKFDEADARKAQTKNMDKYARNMLFARCISNGVKWYCPDVFNGNAVYVPEELGADVNGDGEVINYTTGEIIEVRDVAGNGRDVAEVMKEKAETEWESASQYDNPFEDEGLDNEDMDIVNSWNSADDAYKWAVDIGACTSIPHARNAMKHAVDAHGGRLSERTKHDIFRDFYLDRKRKLDEMVDAAIEEAEPMEA